MYNAMCCVEFQLLIPLSWLFLFYSKNILLESRMVDLSTDEEGETSHSSESKDDQSSSSNSSTSLEEEFSSIGW